MSEHFVSASAIDDLEIEVLETRYEMDTPAAVSTCTGPPPIKLPSVSIHFPPPSTCTPF